MHYRLHYGARYLVSPMKNAAQMREKQNVDPYLQPPHACYDVHEEPVTQRAYRTHRGR